jgi:V/A-type H+/Na+-transporting ATPase subunit C
MANGLDALHYASANARMRGLRSRLLSDDTWRELVATESLASTLNVLRSTEYGPIVADVEQGGAFSLAQLEQQLSGQAAENCRRAMALTTGSVRALIQVWWQHFELENLKALLRGAEQRMEPDAIQQFLVPLGADSTLSWDTLLHEHSISSLIERLGRTHYGNALRNAYPVYEREHVLAVLEIALDVRYYRDVDTAIKHLGGSDRDEARSVLGTLLDILNILWAFRYRVYYQMSVEEIVNYTLWHTVRTDTGVIRDIALGADPRDILLRLWGEGAIDLSLLRDYGPLAQMMPRLELTLYRFWRHRAEREMAGYPFKLGAILGYLVLQELEARDLVTLLEGKGMGWTPERIEQHLIRHKE